VRKDHRRRPAESQISTSRPSRATNDNGDFPHNTLVPTEAVAAGLLRAGHSISQIAEWTRLPFAVLFAIRDSRKRRRQGHYKRLPQETIAKMRDAYLSGLDWYQIAEQFGCHWCTVRKHVSDLRR
jgi:hypothetical protein